MPLRQGTRAATAPERHRTARQGAPNRITWWGVMQYFPTRKVQRRWTTVVPEVLRSFYVAGGQGDKRRLSDHGDRKAAPLDHVAARVRQFMCLTLGKLAKDSRPATTRDLKSSKRKSLQGKIVSILCYDAPQGRLSRAGEGFSLVVSNA